MSELEQIHLLKAENHRLMTENERLRGLESSKRLFELEKQLKQFVDVANRVKKLLK